jgi:hypothetical protein
MTLREYLMTINKNDCPPDCEFKSKKNIGIAWVPPPSNKILGVIVSRDPTIDWLYSYLSSEDEENTRRKILFASAIPLSLMTKVAIFMRGDRNFKNNEKCLFDVIFHKIYWTHLHKCFTETKNAPFKGGNATKCADEWLKGELDLVINNKTKFIIALGNHVQRWVKKWKENEGRDRNIKIINLPHPSGQNNRIWYCSKKDEYSELKREIRNLVKLCKGD